MSPVPRRTLCHDDPPGRVRPSISAEPEVVAPPGRSSSAVAVSSPAAASAASPSATSMPISGLLRPSGPQIASTALPRLRRSLRRFHRLMSSTTKELKVAAPKSAETARVVRSLPPGKRPMSNIPVVGDDHACTTPGSR